VWLYQVLVDVRFWPEAGIAPIELPIAQLMSNSTAMPRERG
jgi:hypothetical protein